MRKRGQVAVFVIIGVLLIFALILVFFLRGTLIKGYKEVVDKEEFLNSQLKEIESAVEKCITRETEKAARLLGEQGGYFNPINYDNYYGMKVAILCNNVVGEDYCNTKPLSILDVNKRLNENLQFNVKNCIDLEPYEGENYQLETGDFKLTSYIQNDNILVEVNFPVRLTFDEVKIEKQKFVKRVNLPLGNSIMLANTILNQEATNGQFDVVSASLLSRGIFTVRERKSFPNKVYIIDFGNGKYKFNFAIEGEA